MREGVWADIKKRKITHFFTLFFRNLQEIKKIKNISFSILLCFMSTIWWFKTVKVYMMQELLPKKKQEIKKGRNKKKKKKEWKYTGRSYF